MNNSDYRPRLSFELTPEQQARVQRLIPWGTHRRLYQAITDSMLDLVEKYGDFAIAAIIAGRISFIEAMKGLEVETDGHK